MDLLDEHGNTIDNMYYAIFNGDFDRIKHPETLDINVIDKSFVNAVVDHDQLRILSYQFEKGTDLEYIIELAEDSTKGVIIEWARS